MRKNTSASSFRRPPVFIVDATSLQKLIDGDAGWENAATSSRTEHDS